jgi:hypothetical protein
MVTSAAQPLDRVVCDRDVILAGDLRSANRVPPCREYF